MEICPKCKRFCAERNHYTNLLICYNRSCDYKEKAKISSIEKIKNLKKELK